MLFFYRKMWLRCFKESLVTIILILHIHQQKKIYFNERFCFSATKVNKGQRTLKSALVNDPAPIALLFSLLFGNHSHVSDWYCENIVSSCHKNFPTYQTQTQPVVSSAFYSIAVERPKQWHGSGLRGKKASYSIFTTLIHSNYTQGHNVNNVSVLRIFDTLGAHSRRA